MITNCMVGRQSLNSCAALRGGNWNNGDNAGVFNANSNTPSNSNTNNGFRCPETVAYRRDLSVPTGFRGKTNCQVSELQAFSS